jgi:DNA-binding MarR family transcriptional regulator
LQVLLSKRTVGRVTTTPSTELAEHLFVLNGRVRRAARQLEAFDEARDSNLTLSQEAALGHLYRGGAMSIADLARLEGLRPQSMGMTIGALEDLGLVAKTPDPDDARRTLLGLTEAGRTRWTDSRNKRTRLLGSRLDRLTDDERATVERALTLLERIVDA